MEGATDVPPSDRVVPDDGTPFSDDPIEHTTLSATFMVVIMVTWLIFGHKIQGMFSWTKWISEGSMACLLGVLSGVLLLIWDLVQSGTTHRSLSFDSAIFFTYMLPPIIFYGGIAIKRRLFVSNLVSIVAFGIIGTFVSFTIIGAALLSLSLLPNVLSFDDCFSLAAIFAATDSVAVLQVLRPESHPALYSIVLGEGVMNDAASVALLRAVGSLSASAALTPATLALLLAFFVYVFAASFALGLLGGLTIAAAMKHLGPFSQPQEVSLVGALAFLCYLIAELLGLSGILALFFCGMAVSHYAMQHVSRPSAAALVNAFRTLSYLIEGFIFLYVGRDALDPAKWAAASFFQTLYMLVIVSALVALSRAAFVFPLAWLHNRWSSTGLTVNDSIVIWWAGMMRGAVSVAMVYYRFDPDNTRADQHSATIVVTTLQVVLYSTVGLGGLTGPLLQVLLPRQVHPPDVTGAQLVGADGSGADSPRHGGYAALGGGSMHGSAGGLGAREMLFPTVDDMSPSSRASDESPHASGRRTLFGRAAKQRPVGQGQLDSGPSKGGGMLQRGLNTGWGRIWGRGGDADLEMKDVDEEAEAAWPVGQPAEAAARSGARAHDAQGLASGSPGANGGATQASSSALPRRGSIKEMGVRYLKMAHAVADRTDFQGTAARGAGVDGKLGKVMYDRFKEFDEEFLQPVFGGGERVPSSQQEAIPELPADLLSADLANREDDDRDVDEEQKADHDR